MPKSRMTRRSPSPNTADGFVMGRRNGTMMSRRKGSVAESAGIWTAEFTGALISPNRLPCPSFPGSRPNSFRQAQAEATRKKTANPPSNDSDAGSPVSVIGMRRIEAPRTTNVSSRTTSTGIDKPVTTASKMASTSTHRIIGQTRYEISARLKMGMSTRSRVKAGKA